MPNTYIGLPRSVLDGRQAVYWSWYCSPRRSSRPYGRDLIGHKSGPHFGDYPGWKVMSSNPHTRYGMAGGKPGAKNRKVHMVRDQIVAKHEVHAEARLTRWICGAYTFEGILQEDATTVCSACLMKSQHRSTEPIPRRWT